MSHEKIITYLSPFPHNIASNKSELKYLFYMNYNMTKVYFLSIKKSD